MKILFVDQSGDVGGAQTTLLQTITALKGGAEIALMAPGGGGLENSFKRSFPLHVFRKINLLQLNHGYKNFLDIIKLLLNNVRVLLSNYIFISKYSVVYVNGPRFVILGAILAVLGKKVIYHIHMDYKKHEKILYYLSMRIKNVKYLIACSDYVYKNFFKFENHGGIGQKLIVIENCLSEKFDSLQFRNKFQDPIEMLNIATIGTIRAEKGQDRIIKLAGANPRALYNIMGNVGVGAEHWVQDLMNVAPRNVKFYQFRNDVDEWLNEENIHIVIVPSRCNEAFGLVAIEAMSASCLTIVWNSGGLIDIANKTGAILCSSEDELQELIDLLITLTPSRLFEIVHDQYSRTKSIYSRVHYDFKMKKLLLNIS